MHICRLRLRLLYYLQFLVIFISISTLVSFGLAAKGTGKGKVTKLPVQPKQTGLTNTRPCTSKGCFLKTDRSGIYCCDKDENGTMGFVYVSKDCEEPLVFGIAAQRCVQPSVVSR
jgi:hypothetical protein